MKPQGYSRREILLRASGVAFSSFVVPNILVHAADDQNSNAGTVIGEPTASKIGSEILAKGGNAVDAAVAAALVAAVVSPNICGIAGYGGHMTIARNGGRQIAAIDFNTAAPQAARADMFALDERGLAVDRRNEFGWLASGVPGTLAGLQLAIDRFGTKSFRELVAPAIHLARDGFAVGAGFAGALRSMTARLRQDPGSAKLYFKEGEAYTAGDWFRNPNLASMLEKLAQANSVDSFYRGEIAEIIARAFRENGGVLTADDLAEYQAREMAPIRFDWGADSILTAPLTAGGFTVLQVLSILKALNWSKRAATPERVHLQVEALRVAWRDRLELLGDPDKSDVPTARLLSDSYARKMANEIEEAVRQKQPLTIEAKAREQGGTIHLSAADRHGNLVALTLTQGNSFGSCVTVDGLGLTFGHGLSRFELRPGHANSVGPGKRPLHNMCPTIVLRDGNPVLALGGAGGRKIVNGVLDVLLSYLTSAPNLQHAVAAPRLNNFGGLDLEMERNWPAADVDYLKSIGFKVASAAGAKVSAVAFDPRTGECQQASR